MRAGQARALRLRRVSARFFCGDFSEIVKPMNGQVDAGREKPDEATQPELLASRRPMEIRPYRKDKNKQTKSFSRIDESTFIFSPDACLSMTKRFAKKIASLR